MVQQTNAPHNLPGFLYVATETINWKHRTSCPDIKEDCSTLGYPQGHNCDNFQITLRRMGHSRPVYTWQSHRQTSPRQPENNMIIVVRNERSMNIFDHLSSLHDYLVNGLVQHVRAPVDGGEPGEALGQLPEPVQRVEVGRLAVPGQGLSVQLDPLHSLDTGLAAVTVISVESHGVTNKVARVLIKTKLFVDFVHGTGGAEILPCLGIIHIEVLGPNQEILESSLFKQTHQVRAERLPLISRDLGDLARLAKDI